MALIFSGLFINYSCYQLFVLKYIFFSLHVFSSINAVVYTVCSHCTLQASLVQVILYLKGLLFIFHFF